MPRAFTPLNVDNDDNALDISAGKCKWCEVYSQPTIFSPFQCLLAGTDIDHGGTPDGPITTESHCRSLISPEASAYTCPHNIHTGNPDSHATSGSSEVRGLSGLSKVALTDSEGSFRPSETSGRFWNLLKFSPQPFKCSIQHVANAASDSLPVNDY